MFVAPRLSLTDVRGFAIIGHTRVKDIRSEHRRKTVFRFPLFQGNHQNNGKIPTHQLLFVMGDAIPNPRHNVFLSHQATDKPVVREVGNQIRSAGMDAILDEWSFRPGKTLTDEIESNIARATALILFWSQAASESDYVQFEDELAIARSIKDSNFGIQVIRLDDTPLPPRYARLIYHDWTKGRPGSKTFDSNVESLIRSLHGLPPAMPDLDKQSISSLLSHEIGHVLVIEHEASTVADRLRQMEMSKDALKRFLDNIGTRKQMLESLHENIVEFRDEFESTYQEPSDDVDEQKDE